MPTTRPLLLGLALGFALSLAPGCPAPPAQPAPTCSDGVHNGGEADVDCGGPCGPCAEGLRCGGATDCASAVCQKGLCRPPGCADGQRNGAETDVDCGGPCPPCAEGQACADAGDCRTRLCGDRRCLALPCGDGLRDGTESDVDCGGVCATCGPGRACATATDCGSRACRDGGCTAPACTDGVRNGAETDLDCGGGCPGCAEGLSCDAGADCRSGACQGATCRPASCSDGVRDGLESDVDCGGPCVPCALGQGCRATADCRAPAHAAVGCDAGLCVPGPCVGEYRDCNQALSDGCEAFMGSTATCRACATVCQGPHANYTCESAGCFFASCAPGFGDCDHTENTGCETPLSTLTDCGACGVACAVAHGQPTCTTGQCLVASCQAGYSDCDADAGNGCEVDRASDPAHCGACGQACVPGPNVTQVACVGGACAVAGCDAGSGNCDGDPATGCEQSLTTSVLHCGACNATCTAPPHGQPACAAGVCGLGTCDPGYGNCDTNPGNGCETNTQVTLAHCGGCGQACAPAHATAAACDAGTCLPVTCAAGWGDCDGVASNGCEVDLTSTATHCNACGTACAAGRVCLGGACQPTACAQLPPTTATGVQTLYSNGTAYQAFCDFDVPGDGGWTLVMKINGNNTTFAYGAALWTDTNTLAAASTDLSQTEAKFASALTTPFTEMKAAMIDGAQTRTITFSTGTKGSLRAALTGAAATASNTSAGPAAWKSLVASPQLQPNCNREGLNVAAAGWSVRVGIISNEQNDCNTPDSFIGFGSNQAAVPTGSLCSFNCTGAACTTKTFGYLYVR